MDRLKRQADLILRDGVFYLMATIDTPEETPFDPAGTPGVDPGLKYLSYDSDGEHYSGKQVDEVRERNAELKADLQSCGTKSAMRHLKKLSDKSKICKFRPHGAMIYDPRILSWKGLDRVSILTLKGRQIIPINIGSYQEERFNRIRGQADFLLRNEVFYLAGTIDAPEPEPIDAEEYLGVDLGIKNIAVDSDGDTYIGGHLNGLRSHHAKVKSKLQGKETKSC